VGVIRTDLSKGNRNRPRGRGKKSRGRQYTLNRYGKTAEKKTGGGLVNLGSNAISNTRGKRL